jgi:hypothetical protein
MGRKANIWTSVDRDYETLRIDMQTLFRARRHPDAARSRIDNILSIGEVQEARRPDRLARNYVHQVLLSRSWPATAARWSSWTGL